MDNLSDEQVMQLIPAERAVILQGFVDSYLIRTDGRPFYEVYPDIEDQYGILNDKQNELLRYYLEDEFKERGRNLQQEILAAGEEIVDGELTDFEEEQLLELADKEIILLGAIMRRKETLAKDEENSN